MLRRVFSPCGLPRLVNTRELEIVDFVNTGGVSSMSDDIGDKGAQKQVATALLHQGFWQSKARLTSRSGIPAAKPFTV